MKKKVTISSLICFITFFICSLFVSAKEYDANMYITETLEEVFTKEGVTNYNLDDYNKTDLDDKRVTIYLFRLSGCQNCKNFLNYTAQTLLQKYGDKIKIISFEMRDNPRNNNLRIDIQKFRGESDNTAPYIVIGNNSWNGPIDSIKQKQIEESIETVYNTQNKYDILQAMSGTLFSHNGVTLISEQALLPNYTLQATLTSRQNLTWEEGYQFIYSLDISMMDGSQIVPIQGSTPMHIHISMPGGFDEYKIAYVDASGNIAEVFDTSYSNYDLSFTTTHLSEYAIFGKKNVSPPIETNPTGPGTGDNTNNDSNTGGIQQLPEGNPGDNSNPPAINDAITEEVPQTFDNIQSYLVLFLFALCTFVVSISLYYRRDSKSSM